MAFETKRSAETRRAMKKQVTAKGAEVLGVTLGSAMVIGNQTVYPVLVDGKDVGSVWCWRPTRGHRADPLNDASWRWGYERPHPSREPRPLTLWRGRLNGRGFMFALYAEDGEPFETRTLAALAVAKRGNVKSVRARVWTA